MRQLADLRVLCPIRNLCGAVRAELRIQQLFGFNLHGFGIRDIEQTILKRHLHRFQLTMHRFNMQLLCKLEFLKDIQRH